MESQFSVSGEYEMKVDSSKAWELYRSLELANLVGKSLPLVDKVEAVQGHGEVGTVLHLIFASGTTGFSSYKEKITKIDEENHIKEAEVVEGGYLDMGFSLYRVRLQVIDKGVLGNCILKSTIEYALKEDADPHASHLVSIQPLQDIARLVESQLLQQAT